MVVLKQKVIGSHGRQERAPSTSDLHYIEAFPAETRRDPPR